MEKLFELTFQDQTLNPQVGTFTDESQATGTFTLEDGEYYLTNGDTKGFYAYAPIAIQPDSETDNKVTIEFDLRSSRPPSIPTQLSAPMPEVTATAYLPALKSHCSTTPEA